MQISSSARVLCHRCGTGTFVNTLYLVTGLLSWLALLSLLAQPVSPLYHEHLLCLLI